MRVIGKSELHGLARTKDRDLREAALAFAAELEAASWRAGDHVLAAYPRGQLTGNCLIVNLDERHCVMVALNFVMGIAVVEYAGLSTSAKRKSSNS